MDVEHPIWSELQFSNEPDIEMTDSLENCTTSNQIGCSTSIECQTEDEFWISVATFILFDQSHTIICQFSLNFRNFN